MRIFILLLLVAYYLVSIVVVSLGNRTESNS